MKDKKEVFLTCEDYTVSHKKFKLIYNSNYDLLETNPQPSELELPSYYKSENYISHTDSKKNITDKLYHLVKKYTLIQKLNLINSFKTTEKKLLDVGCGTGDFLKICKNDNWKTIGIEPNESAKKIAKNKLGEEAVLYTNINEIKNLKFDVITLWHVLEHVSDLEFYISKLKSLLKPNGFLVIAVPNYKSFDAKYYKQFWAAFDVPRHLWHFSKKSISLLFQNEKFMLIKILPMYFDSFYVSILSEKNKNKKGNFIKAIFIGLLSNFKALSSKEFSSQIYVLKSE